SGKIIADSAGATIDLEVNGGVFAEANSLIDPLTITINANGNIEIGTNAKVIALTSVLFNANGGNVTTDDSSLVQAGTTVTANASVGIEVGTNAQVTAGTSSVLLNANGGN